LRSARVTLIGGQQATVHVKLNSTGHRLLASRHNLRVTLTTTSKAADGKNVVVRSQKVTFKAAKRSANG
jgi:hypothetical protein